MCRFTFYKGPEIAVSSLLTEPDHSLVRQSLASEERAQPMNGDGFGLAWYAGLEDGAPGLFRSVKPAWNDANLASLARVVRSRCLLAHVRAATGVRVVAEANCHPFVAGRLSFMHNGDLGDFPLVRRALLAELSDEAFDRIRGHTDSEHLFALFLDELPGGAELTATVLAEALMEAFRRALHLSRGLGKGADSVLNVVVSDGCSAVATRFTTRADHDGESLYWNAGQRYLCEDGNCRMTRAPEGEQAVLVSSERLSTDPGWQRVPRNHMLCIGPDQSVVVEPIRL